MKLHDLLSTWTTRSAGHRSRRTRRRKLAIESLESRHLLTAGELDLTFGSDGRVLTDVGQGSGDYGSGIAAYQSDGKIVVAGGTDGGGEDFAVVRYNNDGSLDTSFGVDGIVTINFGGYDFAFGVAVDSADRVLVAGYSYQGATGYDFAVARLTTGGALDPSFGTDGTQTIDFDFSNGFDIGQSVAVDSADRVLVVGYTYQDTTGIDFAVARLTTGGALDSTFDTDGKQTVSFGNNTDAGSSVTVDSFDRVLVAGRSNQGGATGVDFAVARLTTGGALDPSFGTDGKQTVDFDSTGDDGFGVAMDSFDRVLVVGASYQAATGIDFAVARLTPDGALDPNFDLDGKQTVDFSSDDDGAYSVAVDSQDRILSSGWSFQNLTGYDFAVARLTPDGALDPSFGTDGKRTVDFGSSDDEAYGVAVDSADRVLVAGYSDQDATGYDFAVARLVNSSPPMSDAGGPYVADEGTPLMLNGSGSTDDGGIFSYQWDLAYDGMTFHVDLTTTSATISHTFADDFSGTIALRVTDGDGESNTDTSSLTVNNVDPNDVDIAASVGELVFAVGSAQPFSGIFKDVGTVDTHTAVWKFTHTNALGATVTETRAGSVFQGSGSGTVSNSFSFAEAGVYQVTLTVTDDDSGATTSLTSLFVVYDPSAGFVTGGGWINSQAGAYTANPALTGKANFGFNSKYKTGTMSQLAKPSFSSRWPTSTSRARATSGWWSQVPRLASEVSVWSTEPAATASS